MKFQPTLKTATALQSNDMDECYFFIDYLYDKGLLQDNRRRRFDGPAHICSYINDELSYRFGKDIDAINETITDMVHQLNELMPTDESMMKVHSDKRACFWFWSELHCIDSLGNIDAAVKEFNPGSHSERVQEVVRKYKSLHLSPNRHKLYTLNRQWARIVSKESFMRYLSAEDESTCQYTWDYLCKPKYNIGNLYNPINHEEQYLSILNFFDFYISSPAEKELLAKKIKPAINQRNHREKKKTDNINKRFYLKNDNVKKLEEILLKRRVTTDKYFNDIIERDFNEYLK